MSKYTVIHDFVTLAKKLKMFGLIWRRQAETRYQLQRPDRILAPSRLLSNGTGGSFP